MTLLEDTFDKGGDPDAEHGQLVRLQLQANLLLGALKGLLGWFEEGPNYNEECGQCYLFYVDSYGLADDLIAAREAVATVEGKQ